MQREDLHDMKVTQIIYPQSVTGYAAFNTAATTTNIDTKDWDSTTFILCLGTIAASDEVLKVYHTNVSVTDAGAAAAAADVVVVRDDNTVVESPAATGFITPTTTGIMHTFVVSYIGDKRWVRVNETAGTKAHIVSLICLQMRGKRPYYTAV